MMQVVPKWKVVVWQGEDEHVFWITDNCLSNVMRKVADMQFSKDGLTQPSCISITAAS